MRIVVTGAGRGIGLELTKQLLTRGEAVEAGVRDPARSAGLDELGRAHADRLRVHACDVADDGSVRSFAEALGHEPIDVIINNAGVIGKLQPLEELDMVDMARTINVNALGPVRLTRALLPLLRKGAARKIVHISSKMGSLADNTGGGSYGYRMSKAALNMASVSMARDLRAAKIATVVLNPGWVKTDMGGKNASTPVAESVRGMLRVIDALTLETSGKFFGFQGDEIPW
jgi:NAD(P)-dependent dehydrogenase (short-subunit alcohol dehydrogenase family)